MSHLLARHAEAVFWLARYVERAASLARILDVQSSFNRGRNEQHSWPSILRLYSDERRFAKHYDLPSAENVVRFYVSDLENPGSIQSSVQQARENARTLRPLISTEMWTQINAFYNRLLGLSPADLDDVRLSRTCEVVKRGCDAHFGVTAATFYRDEGWLFHELGMWIERADQLSRLLDVKFAQLGSGRPEPGSSQEVAFWNVLLRSSGAYHAFRRVSPRGMEPDDVAHFLLFNRCFPRSLSFCVNEIQRSILEMRSGSTLRLVDDLLEQIDVLSEGLQAAAADERLGPKLHEFNDWVQCRLMEMTSQIGITFFGHEHDPADQQQSQAQSQDVAAH